MNEDWKHAIKYVDHHILQELHKVACEQNDCANDVADYGKCAYCADMAECIVGTYLILTGQYKP